MCLDRGRTLELLDETQSNMQSPQVESWGWDSNLHLGEHVRSQCYPLNHQYHVRSQCFPVNHSIMWGHSATQWTTSIVMSQWYLVNHQYRVRLQCYPVNCQYLPMIFFCILSYLISHFINKKGKVHTIPEGEHCPCELIPICLLIGCNSMSNRHHLWNLMEPYGGWHGDVKPPGLGVVMLPLALCGFCMFSLCVTFLLYMQSKKVFVGVWLVMDWHHIDDNPLPWALCFFGKIPEFLQSCTG